MHYLDPNDVKRVSEQKACISRCVFYFKKKGAQRNQEQMLSEINEKIRETRKKIEYAVSDLERLTERRTNIEAGDLGVYL